LGCCSEIFNVSSRDRKTNGDLTYLDDRVRLADEAEMRSAYWAGVHVIADFTRWFLALFFVGVAAFYTVRILVAKSNMQQTPVFTGDPGTLHWATHTTFRLFRVLILGVCLVRLSWPGLDKYLVIFDALWRPPVLMLGNGLLLGGFTAVVALHFYMGKEWRSGTRANDETRLITKGPFAISRNPMMLCVMTAQVGLFLALPSVFTLICLAVGIWAVTAQVDVEERVLGQRFGAAYEAYATRTPRWLVFR
jgi:protein-S-isoprenylcysteine O-methyltransferase Ste14